MTVGLQWYAEMTKEGHVKRIFGVSNLLDLSRRENMLIGPLSANPPPKEEMRILVKAFRKQLGEREKDATKTELVIAKETGSAANPGYSRTDYSHGGTSRYQYTQDITTPDKDQKPTVVSF